MSTHDIDGHLTVSITDGVVRWSPPEQSAESVLRDLRGQAVEADWRAQMLWDLAEIVRARIAKETP